MKAKDKRTGCIYKIQTPEGPYVGSTITGFSYRWSGHVGQLRKGAHGNKDLQAQWDKYGPIQFSFHVLEVDIAPEKLQKREEHWIVNLDAHKTGMNIESKSGQAIRKQEAIDEIVEAIKLPMRYRDIAERFDVSLGTVSNINKKYILGT